jgi:hypothetical protein
MTEPNTETKKQKKTADIAAYMREYQKSHGYQYQKDYYRQNTEKIKDYGKEYYIHKMSGWKSANMTIDDVEKEREKVAQAFKTIDKKTYLLNRKLRELELIEKNIKKREVESQTQN